MKRAKIAACFFIIIGLAAVIYPVYLNIESRIEQKKMIENFENSKGYEYTALKDIAISSEEIEKGNDKSIVYTSWPETLINIPKLKVKAAVVEMEDVKVFEKKINCPPAHYKGTAFPGQKGNVAIAGHRNGPAGYFKYVNKLKEGDVIILETSDASYEYIVERVYITDNDDWDAVAPLNYCGLTITTCQREGIFSNTKRLVVRAKLKS